MDSLEQNSTNLRSITGSHKWINSNEQIRVENYLNHPTANIVERKLFINQKLDDEIKDLSIRHFDVQLQVTNGQLQPINRYGVFTSVLPQKNSIRKLDQSSQTIEPEMDMENDHHERRTRSSNGYSQQYNSNGGGGGYRQSHRNGGSGGGGSGDGNGWNPNRNQHTNNNNDDEDDESDENFARRLGFRSIDSETLRTVHRLRNLANRSSSSQRDLDDLQYLIDELVRLQHLENFSQEQLENFVDVLKLDRIFQNKSQALSFIQDRFPRRFSRANQETSSNVFNLWRERERRRRHDSTDSLEDEGANNRDQNETSQSKVKQMARNIDTKRTDEQFTTSDNVRTEVLTDEHSRFNENLTTTSSPEQHRVRQMISRLESTTTENNPAPKRPILKQTYRTDYVEEIPTNGGSIRREYQEQRWSNENNKNSERYDSRRRSPDDDVFARDNQTNGTRFELQRKGTTAHRTTINDYMTTLLPNTETAISVVRDFRAHIYDDESTSSYADGDHIPVKVDLETLYILEQRADRPLTPIDNNEANRSTSRERYDFAVQTTTIPTTTTATISNRPVGTQVDTQIEQNTVAAKTTDSLNRSARLFHDEIDDDDDEEEGTSKIIRSTTTTTISKIIRRRSGHHTSDDEDDVNDNGGNIVIHFDEEDNTNYRQVTHGLSTRDNLDDVRSDEVYEIHTRGACKVLVVSHDEPTQYGSETALERQIKQIERSYTNVELQAIELHVIVTTSDRNYRLVRRDYGNTIRSNDDQKRQPCAIIHYYTADGQRMATEQARPLDQLPLFIRCEIEYELNHYNSAHLIILAVTNAERTRVSTTVKNEVIRQAAARLAGRYEPNSREFREEFCRYLHESISIRHLVDYSSRDDLNSVRPIDLRHVLRTDVSTSLRIVQHYRTLIHNLCQQYRSHILLTPQAEQQRQLILVAHNDYYLLDLATQQIASINRTEFRQQQQQQQREVRHVPQQPFDYQKYRREVAQQQRIIEQHYQQQQRQQQTKKVQPTEPEFYLGAGRRALIEREIHSMRESIRPHEHAPPQYKHEPKRRSLSISYSGSQRYVRARIIHVKDYYEENAQRQQIQQQPQQPPPNAKEQELFVRVDDYINETAADSLRRSYSTDYLREDGPRSRIRYIRIPGETIRIEEKTTYEYQGVMYANLPYSLRYWNILQILDREAREGRPLGSSLPHVIVNDPYQTVIPPLTQQEIRQTAQQVLSSQYQPRTYTDQTLRWFLSRDNRTEIESTKYLRALQQQQQHHHQQQQQHRQRQAQVTVQQSGQQGVADKYFVTETLVRYEKMPDRLVPLAVRDRAQSIGNLHQQHHHSPSTTRTVQQSFHSQNNLNRSQSQPRQHAHSTFSVFTPNNNNRSYLPSNPMPLSRHQSVHELHARQTYSQPPSPSPSLHSLHSNHQVQHRRPVAFHNRFPTAQGQNPMLTEIFDSQTGQRILATSQEQLPTAVQGLLNRYNNLQ